MKMTSTAQGVKTEGITLKGSAVLISDFLNIGVNSILFQRGVYPYESFQRQSKYGLPVFMSVDTELTHYMEKFMSQLKVWLVQKTIQRIVLCIARVDTLECVERWQFNVECDKTADESTVRTERSLEKIQANIREVAKQIVSTVTFLPHLEGLLSFNIIAYTDRDCGVPVAWETGKDHVIAGAENVKLNSVLTGIHKVDVDVCYKVL